MNESERTFKVSFEYNSFVKAPDAKTAVEMAHPLLSFYLEKHPEKLTVIEITERPSGGYVMNEIYRLCQELRILGCAVACFTPEELRGVSPDTVEDMLIEYGWDTIDFHTMDKFDDRP